MIKKIGISALLISTIVFGSGFSHNINVKTIDTNNNSHYFYNKEEIQSYLQQWLTKYTENKVEVNTDSHYQQEQTNSNTTTETPKEESVTQEDESTNKEQVSSELNQFELEVIELTNAEREKAGLSPLELDEALSKVAREKSKDMAENNYFSHQSPTYGSPFDMMKQYGISYRTAGENIAKGQQSPEEVVQAWMNSEGHRKNILNPDFTHIGIGYVGNGNVWTQQFIAK
ncbi:CAP domain-containing protein [Gracilibacillus marinus]|uniref:CAP domain-containing protein n=1 Tax=Gracilibacillus marinus TaxID=630535 RepID=A0ABV8VP51_9BACI